MGMACGTYGERIGVNRVIMRRPEGWRTLVRPRHKWEDNI
jgi:hypothetical protein